MSLAQQVIGSCPSHKVAAFKSSRRSTAVNRRSIVVSAKHDDRWEAKVQVLHRARWDCGQTRCVNKDN